MRYIYPSRSDSRVAQVQSWVSANYAELDLLLHDAVANWLAAEWPFTDVRYRPLGVAPDERRLAVVVDAQSAEAAAWTSAIELTYA